MGSWAGCALYNTISVERLHILLRQLSDRWKYCLEEVPFSVSLREVLLSGGDFVP